MPLAGGQGGRNLRVQLTLLQPEGAVYAHHITASPPGFEIPVASLNCVCQSTLISLINVEVGINVEGVQNFPNH